MIITARIQEKLENSRTHVLMVIDYFSQCNLSFIAGTTDFASKTGKILVKPRYVDTNGLGILEAHKIETLNELINNSLLYC